MAEHHTVLGVLASGDGVVQYRDNPPTHAADRCQCKRFCPEWLWGKAWTIVHKGKHWHTNCAIAAKLTTADELLALERKLHPRTERVDPPKDHELEFEMPPDSSELANLLTTMIEKERAA